jgi:hypothetical protein
MSSPFHRRGLAFVAALSLALPACGPSLTPEPDPTPVVFHVQITPTLNNLRPLFQSCAAEQPQASLVVSEVPAPALSQASLSLRWGGQSLPPGSASILGEEELVLIVHPGNPLDRIPAADLRAIYQGTLQTWPNDGPSGDVRPYVYPAEEDIQQVFEAAVGAPLPANVSALAPDPGAMLEAIAGNPDAIGFVPRGWLDRRVRPVQIEGIDGRLLRQPVLAISQSELQEPEKSWLLCLQAGMAE